MLRVPLAELCAGERVLDDTSARYVTRVHRLETGAVFLAFDPVASLEAEAELLSTGRQVSVRMGRPVPCANVPRRRVTVIQTASKGTKIDDVLRDATELGVTRFVIAIGIRSVKRPLASQLPRWTRIAVQAARQCGRGDVPELVGPLPLGDALAEPGTVRWLLEPRGDSLQNAALAALAAMAGSDGATVLVVGPEGGFAPEELAVADRLDYRRVALGPFILRTETACAAALGALLATTGAS